LAPSGPAIYAGWGSTVSFTSWDEDSKVKSRGYRIELGEIEAALATFEDIRESAVVAVATDRFEGLAICCACVPRASDQTASDVRRRLPPTPPALHGSVAVAGDELLAEERQRQDRPASASRAVRSRSRPLRPEPPRPEPAIGAAEMNPAGDESVKRVDGWMKNVLATTPDNADQDLIESGLLDSMALIELLYAIEEEFTVELLSKISMLSS
jgi:hypothetical protein